MGNFPGVEEMVECETLGDEAKPCGEAFIADEYAGMFAEETFTCQECSSTAYSTCPLFAVESNGCVDASGLSHDDLSHDDLSHDDLSHEDCSGTTKLLSGATKEI